MKINIKDYKFRIDTLEIISSIGIIVASFFIGRYSQFTSSILSSETFINKYVKCIMFFFAAFYFGGILSRLYMLFVNDKIPKTYYLYSGSYTILTILVIVDIVFSIRLSISNPVFSSVFSLLFGLYFGFQFFCEIMEESNTDITKDEIKDHDHSLGNNISYLIIFLVIAIPIDILFESFSKGKQFDAIFNIILVFSILFLGSKIDTIIENKVDVNSENDLVTSFIIIVLSILSVIGVLFWDNSIYQLSNNKKDDPYISFIFASFLGLVPIKAYYTIFFTIGKLGKIISIICILCFILQKANILFISP